MRYQCCTPTHHLHYDWEQQFHDFSHTLKIHYCLRSDLQFSKAFSTDFNIIWILKRQKSFKTRTYSRKWVDFKQCTIRISCRASILDCKIIYGWLMWTSRTSLTFPISQLWRLLTLLMAINETKMRPQELYSTPSMLLFGCWSRIDIFPELWKVGGGSPLTFIGKWTGQLHFGALENKVPKISWFNHLQSFYLWILGKFAVPFCTLG